MIVELFDIRDTDRLRAALAIRTSVFVCEQRVPPEEEIDEHDRTDVAAVHALARASAADGSAPLGAGRFYIREPTTVRIGRMAVSARARGRGVGRALLGALVAEARGRGFARAELHAQTHAAEFYRKAGFSDDGAPLWDAGIEHQPMSLDLRT
ncbi:MAG: GNAT family N-acetyltransferase [Vulcanimicrobiaceae bacterium]